jgi:hypothetical protein
MMDQKRNFCSKGINAEFVGEAQVDKEAVKSILSGSVPLLLINPAQK